MAFVSSEEYPSGKIIEFDIESAKNGTSKEAQNIYNQLSPFKELNYGKVHIQKNNDEFWYINPEGTAAFYLSEDRFNLLNRWDNEELLPDNTQLAILSEIKGLPSVQYSLYPKSVNYPIKVKIKNGIQIDHCICHFSEFPPVQRWFKNIILLNDIIDISSSDLTLSHELRLSSMLADEIRMSFYPFMVKKVDGSIITYNGITQFASSGEIKGNEIECEIAFSYDKLNKVYSNSEDVTYIVGKWDERLSKEFEKYSAELNSIQNSRVNLERISPNKQGLFARLFSWIKS